MLTWHSSANLMSNGVLSAIKHDITDSGTPTTQNWWRSGLHFAPRTYETRCELLELFALFTIGMLTTDEWESYNRELPKEKNLTGKIFTLRIERNNLTLRTRIKRLARRTVNFSRSVKLHEKVIGTFIENIYSTNWHHHL